jgi:mersacidin/lichenicidin family type 2 lantibiotic
MRIEMEKIMSNNNIIRAWKDPVYRNSLSEAERAVLPANPAGSIEISDADLGNVAGGLAFPTVGCHTGGFCGVTFPRCQ